MMPQCADLSVAHSGDINQTGLTDESLITAYRTSGQGEVLDALVARHLPGVRGVLFQMVLNESDADELTQETFLRAVRGLDQFNGAAKFSTWLYRIALNIARTHLRKQSRRSPTVPLREHDPAGPDEPDRRLLHEERNREVAAAVGELPPSLRAAIVLTTLQGLSVRQAADIENCAVSTMYWRIDEARRTLKHRLQSYVQP